MKNIRLYGFLAVVFMVSISFASWNCANKESKTIAQLKNNKTVYSLSFDSTLVETFYLCYKNTKSNPIVNSIFTFLYQIIPIIFMV